MALSPSPAPGSSVGHRKVLSHSLCGKLLQNERVWGEGCEIDRTTCESSPLHPRTEAEETESPNSSKSAIYSSLSEPLGEKSISQSKKNVCGYCSSSENLLASVRLLKCSACFSVFYCSKSCQRAHWLDHEPICRGISAHRKVIALSSITNEAEIFDCNGAVHQQDKSICGSLPITMTELENLPPLNKDGSATSERAALLVARVDRIYREQENMLLEVNKVLDSLRETLKKHNIAVPQMRHHALHPTISNQISLLNQSVSQHSPEYPLEDGIASSVHTLTPSDDQFFHTVDRQSKIALDDLNHPVVEPLSPSSLKKRSLFLDSVLQRCSSSDLSLQLDAAKECRKVLSDQNPPISELIESGLVPLFVEFLKEKSSPDLQFEAAWILTNICSGTSEQTEAVVNSGAIPLFIDLLSSNDMELAEQCIWALGNIAADSPTCRDILLDHHIISSLIPLLDSQQLTILKNISWTMSNLCNGVSEFYWSHIVEALPQYAKLLFLNEEDIVKDVCWSLSCFSCGIKQRIQRILDLDPQICRRLVDLLIHPNSSLAHAALVTIGNIATGDDVQTQVLVDLKLLPRLRRLLSHPKKSILKDACFATGNIAAGNPEQIQAIIDAKLIPPLLQLFSPQNKREIKIEAVWVLANIFSNGNFEQIRYLVDTGSIKLMCSLLSQCDYATAEAIFEGLENILRVGRDEFERNRSSSTPSGNPITRNPFLKLLSNQAAESLRSLQISDDILSQRQSQIIHFLDQSASAAAKKTPIPVEPYHFFGESHTFPKPPNSRPLLVTRKTRNIKVFSFYQSMFSSAPTPMTTQGHSVGLSS